MLLARILYSLKQGFIALTFEDWDIANNLIKYGVYAEFIEVGSTAYKMPVNPLFLAFFVWLFGKNAMMMAVIAQSIIYFLIPILIVRICKIFSQEKVGMLTSYFFIFSPFYFIYVNTLENTNIFILIFLNFLYWFFKIWKQGSTNKRVILFSISSALLFLCQVVTVPFGIILIISLFLFKKIEVKKVLIIASLVFVLYSPWVIRNYIVFDRIILSKTPVWQNRHFGYFEETQVFKDLQKVPLKKAGEIRRIRTHTNEFQMEKIYKREVLEFEKKDKYLIIKKALANFLYLWYVPSRYFYDNSFSIIGRKVFVMTINLLTVFSLISLIKRKQCLLFMFSILLFINFTVPYMIGQAAMTRFKLDFEWYQLFLAAYFLKFNFKRFGNDSLAKN